MKQFTVKEILKRYNHGACDWYEVNPAPFPGKYPTRLLLYVDRMGDRGIEPKFEYLGKPSPTAIRAFANVVNRNCYRLNVLEFDRKNMVAAFSWLGAYGRRLQQTNWRLGMSYRNGTLWHVYYPWDGILRMLYMHMQPWWPKRVGGIPCYSPHQTLSIIDQIEPHKRWLKQRGLLREQRTKTVAA